MNEEEYTLKLQEQFGRVYRENDIIIFQAQVLQLSTVVSIVMLLLFSSLDPKFSFYHDAFLNALI